MAKKNGYYSRKWLNKKEDIPEELSKMDELIGRRVHEELTKIND